MHITVPVSLHLPLADTSLPDQTDTQTHIAIAAIRFETFTSHHQRDQRDVRTVHRLKCDAIAAAFPGRFIDQFSKTFDHFSKD